MTTAVQIPAHLSSTHNGDVCYTGSCPQAVKMAPWGTWYVTMWHPGFNTDVNNSCGYNSEQAARAIVRRYAVTARLASPLRKRRER